MKVRFLVILSLVLATITVHAQESVFVVNGQYTVPAGVSSVYIELVGAGGNGKGNGLSGGGGGGYAAGIYAVTPGQVLDVSVAQAGTSEISQVDALIQATSGTNATYDRDSDGYGVVGLGGIGTGGTICNFRGGNGGKGFWTYYGGGGGGAAGANGNGFSGGDTHPYDSNGCSHLGGSAGKSGGFPGGEGSKGAGYLNCGHGSANWNPATPAVNYGGGGGGGNGSSSPSTNGASGYVRISPNLIHGGVNQIGLTLHAIELAATYQWIDENSQPITGATDKAYKVTQPGTYAVIITKNGQERTSNSIEISTSDLADYSREFGSFTYEANSTFYHDQLVTNTVFIETVGAGGNGRSNGLSGGGGGGYAAGVYSLSQAQALTITVAQTSADDLSKVDALIQATSGTDASYSRDAEGYGIVGVGGIGSGGTISNYTGGNGGKGFWTYYGGGGGGAAGPKGNGSNGGDTQPYDSNGCSHLGGSPGVSGGFPGGDGSKGAGYLNCGHGSANWNPATPAINYGGGGGGGNGSSSPSTNGASGFVKVSYCQIYLDITRDGNSLTLNNPTGIDFQWVRIDENNEIEFLSGEHNPTFVMPTNTDQYALYAYDDLCSIISEPYQPNVPTNIGFTKPSSSVLGTVKVYPNPAQDVIFLWKRIKLSIKYNSYR
ncbi:hypothetical protein [Carboxylicivirga sp. N1Y90]|uniref:glycine-rich domain-containing protein n=1 Tax=Carboxylicivirga fragile TaxID=3417571 RepID=UPI003D34185A|nr:hypothetical protein [Marinilabiliaceae bacterium N1Y90]